MRWCVIYHPELHATGVIAESALPLHKARGWYRVSGWSDDPENVRAELARGVLRDEPVATEPLEAAEAPSPPVSAGHPPDLDEQPDPEPRKPAKTFIKERN